MRKLECHEIATVSGANCYTCTYNHQFLRDTFDLIEHESKLSGVVVAALLAVTAIPFGVPVGIIAVGSTVAGLYVYEYEKQNHELSPWN